MKFLKTFFISLFLVFLLISISLYISRNSIIKSIITKISIKIFKTSFSLEKVKTKIFNGNINLKNIKINNPNNWKKANTIEIKEININIEPLSLLNDTIIINQLTIHSPYILYNFQLKNLKDNINAILDNIINKKTITTSAKIKPKLNIEKKFLISKLQILNTTVITKINSIKNQFTISNIIIKDINYKKLTIKELIKIVEKKILLNINDKKLTIKSTELKETKKNMKIIKDYIQ